MPTSNFVFIKSKQEISALRAKLFPAVRAAVCKSAPPGTADRLLSGVNELLAALGNCSSEYSPGRAIRNWAVDERQGFGSLYCNETHPADCDLSEEVDKSFQPVVARSASPLAPFTGKGEWSGQDSVENVILSQVDDEFTPQASVINLDPETESPKGFLGSRVPSPPLSPLNLAPLCFPCSSRTPHRKKELHRSTPGPSRPSRPSPSLSRPSRVVTRSISKKKRSSANDRHS